MVEGMLGTVGLLTRTNVALEDKARVGKFLFSPKGKNFLTENEAEFQLASFNLDSDTQIKRHIHPNQKRNINTTTETLVVIEGIMKVDIYDESLDFIESDIASLSWLRNIVVMPCTFSVWRYMYKRGWSE